MKIIVSSWLVTCVLVASTTANYGSGKAPTVPLNDGREIPVLGLGTSLGGGSREKFNEAVEEAIAAGYRHIDTAAYYKTESAVGNAIRKKIDDGTVKREDIFVTTKLWNDKHAEKDVIPALRESLGNLGLEYVDLYLIHWPVGQYENGTFDNTDYLETWRGMEEAQKLGLAKSIGVSNFNVAQLQRLIKESKVKPAVNQVEVNPNLGQVDLLEYCKSQDIVVVAYSPLGSMPERRKSNSAPKPGLDDPQLMSIGEKYNKNTVQVVLRYLIDRGVVPIPKSSTPSRIRANIDVFDFKLTPEEIQKIDEFNIDYRIIKVPQWKESPLYPF